LAKGLYDDGSAEGMGMSIECDKSYSPEAMDPTVARSVCHHHSVDFILYSPTSQITNLPLLPVDRFPSISLLFFLLLDSILAWILLRI